MEVMMVVFLVMSFWKTAVPKWFHDAEAGGFPVVGIRPIGSGRKCMEENFNTVRKCVKIRILAFKKFGRKC